MYLKGKQTPQ